MLFILTISGVVGKLRPLREASPPKHMSGLELGACVVADLCPHGMLPLAWSARTTGVVPTLCCLFGFGAVSSYTLYLSSELDDGRGPASLSTLWKSARMPGASVVDGLIFVLCGGCCIFYAAFAADIFQALTNGGRTAVLASLFLGPLGPLCLLEDMSALKYSSYAGLVGVFFTALTLLSQTPTYSPSLWATQGASTLMNSLVVAFMCHYNAVQYYRELNKRTPGKYAKVVLRALAATASVFACSLFGGLVAFGHQAKPNVLNNLVPGPMTTLAKLGTGLAILSGFPLIFAGLKAAVPLPKVAHTLVLLGIAGIAAVASEDDIGLVIELLGATVGVAAAYVIPGICAARSSSLPGKHRVGGAAVATSGGLLSLASTLLTLRHF